MKSGDAIVTELRFRFKKNGMDGSLFETLFEMPEFAYN